MTCWVCVESMTTQVMVFFFFPFCLHTGNNVSMRSFKDVQHHHKQQSQTSSLAADMGYAGVVWSRGSDKLMFYSSPCMSDLFPVVTFPLYVWLCAFRFLTISDGISTAGCRQRCLKENFFFLRKRNCGRLLCNSKGDFCCKILELQRLFQRESADPKSTRNVCSLNSLAHSWKK